MKKYYWDTSAMINAAISDRVAQRLDADTHLARVHNLSEFFAIMTGRGVEVPGLGARAVWSPQDASKWLRDFVSKVEIVELSAKEWLDGIDKAGSKVLGTRVYDYGHALAALKGGADVVLTRNRSDFESLTGKTAIEHP
jgi:predicted nucleic acid-binding protein